MRLGSALQHDKVRQRRAEAHRLFVADAVGRAPNSPVVSEEVQRLMEVGRACGRKQSGKTTTKKRTGG